MSAALRRWCADSTVISGLTSYRSPRRTTMPNSLHDVIAGHVDRIAVARKDFRRGGETIDFLDRHDVGVQVLRVLGEAGEIVVGAWLHVRRQIGVAG